MQGKTGDTQQATHDSWHMTWYNWFFFIIIIIYYSLILVLLLVSVQCTLHTGSFTLHTQRSPFPQTTAPPHHGVNSAAPLHMFTVRHVTQVGLAHTPSQCPLIVLYNILSTVFFLHLYSQGISGEIPGNICSCTGEHWVQKYQYSLVQYTGQSQSKAWQGN